MTADAVAWLEAEFEATRNLPHYRRSVHVRCLLDLLPTDQVYTDATASWPAPLPQHDLDSQLALLQERLARWSA